MISVLIADDHTIVRRGLAQILEEVPDIQVAGQASTGRQAIKMAWENDYDVLVLDIVMPDSSGLEVLNQLRCLKPELPVLMLSMYSERHYAVRTLRAGAAGYLTKECSPEELIAAIRKVARGGTSVTPLLAEELGSALRADSGGESHESLSDREYQVMRLLASGKSITDIARELSLGVTTVSTYRVRILEKLALRSTAEIVRYALDRGLLDPGGC